MRLRLVPWVWKRLAFPERILKGATVRNFDTIMNAQRADRLLATSVRYFYVFLYPWLGTDSCFMKDYDDVFHGVGVRHLPSVR